MVPIVYAKEDIDRRERICDRYNLIAGFIGRRYSLCDWKSDKTYKDESPLTKKLALTLLIGSRMEKGCYSKEEIKVRLRDSFSNARILAKRFKEQTEIILQGEWDKARV